MALIVMTRRRALVVATALLSVVAFLLASWPFMVSLSPSATAGQSLLHLNIRGLQPGEYEYFDGSFYTRSRKEHVLVIRQSNGSFSVLLINSIDRRVVLPDLQWWGIGAICSKFSLPFPRGRLPNDGQLRCLDDTQIDGLDDRRRWDSEGKNIARYWADFLSPRFVVEGDFIVVGKWLR